MDTFFHGWIDNRAALAARFDLPLDASHATVYRHAVRQWAEDADRHVIGNYAAVTVRKDGSLRLARSAWNAPPLSYARWQGCLIAASLPEAFFRLGMPRALDRDAIIDQIAMTHDPRADLSPFENIHRVSIGSCLIVSSNGSARANWYDSSAIKPVRYRSDDDYLARAEELLSEAAMSAAQFSKNPAIALSGGLDSPIVAHELLRWLPDESSLTSITFRPDSTFAEADRQGTLADEGPVVERFLAMHPQIEGHFADRHHGGIDHRFREITQLAGTFNAGLAMFGAHHGIWEKAKALGCSDLFGADLGNATFSSDGRWAYAEQFGRLRWGSLFALLRDRPNDPRPAWRRFSSLAVLPHLPRQMRAKLQGAVHSDRRNTLAWNTMLSASAGANYRKRASRQGAWPVWEGLAYARNRRDAVRGEIDDSRSEMAEITLALELRYGVQYRDVTAYRPLVEFCLGLPTEQFVRPGQERFLAKRMAKGRMPEHQYRGARHGRHNADWLVRLKRDRNRFLEQVEAMRGHPWLAEVLDLDRMQHSLLNLPDTAGENDLTMLPYLQGIGRAVLAGQFVGIVEGRNDF